MVNEDSISIIVPALNEEKNIEPAIITILEAAKRRFAEYEIIIFNDGSTDRTAEVAERLAVHNENIRVIHHKKPKCLGSIYKEGIKLAKMCYLIRINGKNDITAENLDKIFALCGKADMIIPYTINQDERSLLRKLISRIFTLLLNTIFRLNLRYYNHYVLYKRAVVNSIGLRTNSYAFQAEILIQLIKSGFSYIEVAVEDRFERDAKTKAFYPRNILGVALFLFNMFEKIYIKKILNI